MIQRNPHVHWRRHRQLQLDAFLKGRLGRGRDATIGETIIQICPRHVDPGGRGTRCASTARVGPASDAAPRRRWRPRAEDNDFGQCGLVGVSKLAGDVRESSCACSSTSRPPSVRLRAHVRTTRAGHQLRLAPDADRLTARAMHLPRLLRAGTTPVLLAEPRLPCDAGEEMALLRGL